MFDPSEVVLDRWRIWVCRYCRTDYAQGSPLRERLNPLRYEIGLRPSRYGPVKWRINRRGQWAVRWSNFLYRMRPHP